MLGVADCCPAHPPVAQLNAPLMSLAERRRVRLPAPKVGPVAPCRPTPGPSDHVFPRTSHGGFGELSTEPGSCAMKDFVRPHVTSGIAIVGAGILLTTSVSAPPTQSGTNLLAAAPVAPAPSTVPDTVPAAGGEAASTPLALLGLIAPGAAAGLGGQCPSRPEWSSASSVAPVLQLGSTARLVASW